MWLGDPHNTEYNNHWYLKILVIVQWKICEWVPFVSDKNLRYAITGSKS